jgi:hypothetical protein
VKCKYVRLPQWTAWTSPESKLKPVLKDNPSLRFYEKMGGKFLGEKELRIGEGAYIECGYGWPGT